LAGKMTGIACSSVRVYRDLMSTCQLLRGHPTLVLELITLLKNTRSTRLPRNNACTQLISPVWQKSDKSSFFKDATNLQEKTTRVLIHASTKAFVRSAKAVAETNHVSLATWD